MLKTLRNIVIFISFLLGLRWLYVTNTTIEFSRIKHCYESLPETFAGFKIAHVSDVHNTRSRKKIDAIYENLQTEQPDIIAITGDSIDSRVTDVSSALQFVQGLTEIAPCYYVTGNHESRFDEETFCYLLGSLTNLGVIVLQNDARMISQDGDKISIVDVDDLQFKKRKALKDTLSSVT